MIRWSNRYLVKDLFFSTHILLISQGKCYSHIVTHLHPLLAEADIRGGALLQHQCSYSGKTAADLSFSFFVLLD